MGQITDWLMVIITAIYVVATICISRSNHNSATAAKEAVEESRKQFVKNIELQTLHNYDSVRPAVSIDFTSSESETSFNGSIIITNHGLGPAIIEELHLRKNNKEYKNSNGYCTLLDLMLLRNAEENSEMPVKEVFHHYYTKEFRNDANNKDYLAAGEQLLLLGFSTRNKQESMVVGKLFHGIQIDLVYTDIYSSQDWTTSSKLSYFKTKWIDSCET